MRTQQEALSRKLAAMVFVASLVFVCEASAIADSSHWLNSESGASLPSFLEKPPMEQFPEYRESTSDILHGLMRYRSELENFREEILEGYNRSVVAFIDQLTDAANQLEMEYMRGTITRAVYDQRHAYLVAELGKTREKGKYMAGYYGCLKKYKSEIKLVAVQIAKKKKEGFRF
jgi:hypothetical protein